MSIIEGGRAHFELKLGSRAISRNFRGRYGFTLRFEPADELLRQAHPELHILSEPFRAVTKLKPIKLEPGAVSPQCVTTPSEPRSDTSSGDGLDTSPAEPWPMTGATGDGSGVIQGSCVSPGSVFSPPDTELGSLVQHWLSELEGLAPAELEKHISMQREKISAVFEENLRISRDVAKLKEILSDRREPTSSSKLQRAISI